MKYLERTGYATRNNSILLLQGSCTGGHNTTGMFTYAKVVSVPI